MEANAAYVLVLDYFVFVVIPVLSKSLLKPSTSGLAICLATTTHYSRLDRHSQYLHFGYQPRGCLDASRAGVDFFVGCQPSVVYQRIPASESLWHYSCDMYTLDTASKSMANAKDNTLPANMRLRPEKQPPERT